MIMNRRLIATSLALCAAAASADNEKGSLRRQLRLFEPETVTQKGQQLVNDVVTDGPPALNLLTVGEMKRSMRLPCNYVHDGYYLADSNEAVNQVFQQLHQLDDDIIPVMIEVGGHDGITKSLSLKSSICLNMNTLLIEASAKNFNVLQKSRAYDMTVNAALCERAEGFIHMVENEHNSGENHVATGSGQVGEVVNVNEVGCTTIDNELDKIRDSLPMDKRDKLRLIHLILDIEGFELVAIGGIQKYSPLQLRMETKQHNPEEKAALNSWAAGHNLSPRGCGGDTCYNFFPMLPTVAAFTKDLFYGARWKTPTDTWETSKVTEAYYFYGE